MRCGSYLVTILTKVVPPTKTPGAAGATTSNRWGMTMGHSGIDFGPVPGLWDPWHHPYTHLEPSGGATRPAGEPAVGGDCRGGASAGLEVGVGAMPWVPEARHRSQIDPRVSHSHPLSNYRRGTGGTGRFSGRHHFGLPCPESIRSLQSAARVIIR